MTTPIIWLHGDSLSPHDPALAAHPAAPAVFVFDEPFLQQAGLSFKRLLFIYESALEAMQGRDFEIRRGAVVPELLDFARSRTASEIHVTETIAPRFARYLAELRRQTRVVLHSPQPLTSWTGAAPRRFSQFWRKVDSAAMRPTGEGPPELQQP